MKTLFCAALAAVSLSASAAVVPGLGGRVNLEDVRMSFALTAADAEWVSFGPRDGFTADADGVVRCTLEREKLPKIACTFRGEETDGGAHLVWTIRPEKDARLALLGVVGRGEYRAFPGGSLEIEGKRIDFPKGERQGIFRGRISRLAVSATNGTRVAFAFAAPVGVYVQNNRRWGSETFSVRLLVPTANGLIPGGVTTTFDVTVTGAGAYRGDSIRPCTLTAGADWVPFAATPWIKPGTALDFSAIRRTEKPAGKYGAVVAKGGHFEFERRPGEPVRFYGINVCGDANTVPLAEARRFAANLARLGYNAIRFHHHESTLVGGMKDPTCCTLNPKAMENFDALVAACVENGIYLTTDLFVSRHNAGLTWRAVGVDRDGTLEMNDAKLLIPVNEKVFANYMTFTRNFLGHVNRYTGRSLAEEPALAGISLINEGNLDKYGARSYQKHPDWQNAYAAWLAKRRAADPVRFARAPASIPGSFTSGDGTAFLLFLQETEAAFAAKVRKVLREELKCRALLTNMNDGSGRTAAFQWVRETCYGYVDSHFYVDHPSFLGTRWRLPSRCPNANPIFGASRGAQSVAFVRVFDRPFTITEYNFSGPGRFRGVGGIACGAQAALQDWAGLWRFAWSHGIRGVTHPERKQMGYFDVSGDPLALAAERASICLFLRGDLQPLKRRYATVIPESYAHGLGTLGTRLYPPCSWASWYAQVGTKIGDRTDADSAGFIADVFAKGTEKARADLLAGAADATLAGDGHLRVDGERGSFLLDTPRTSGGFAEGGRIDCGALRADLGATAATLWASSLSDEPIRESKRILVTYLTDVQNTDIRYADSTLTVLLGWGHLPHLMRNGEADVSLAVGPGSWKVWALDPDGTRREEVPSARAGDRLSFRVDVDRSPRAASYLYEVAADGDR